MSRCNPPPLYTPYHDKNSGSRKAGAYIVPKNSASPSILELAHSILQATRITFTTYFVGEHFAPIILILCGSGYYPTNQLKTWICQFASKTIRRRNHRIHANKTFAVSTLRNKGQTTLLYWLFDINLVLPSIQNLLHVSIISQN